MAAQKGYANQIVARGWIWIGIALCAAWGSARAMAADEPATLSHHQSEKIWAGEVLEAFSHWPIQDQGRIKPLSTFARFKLVKLSGRTSMKTPDEQRLQALPWLLNTMFYPERASAYKVVRIENPAVMQALGLSDEK